MPSFNNLEYPVDNYAAGVTENIGAISVDEASQIPRSTTPDIPVPSELSFSYTPFITQLPNINGPNVVRGGYTEKLANACSIPLGVPQEVFEQRCADIMATLASNTANVLPLPSPKVKHIPDPGVPSEAYKIRQKPARIRITPLLPKQKVEHYKPVQDLPEGPEKEAAKEYNNKVSKARSGRDKARNNEAANRTRDRKKRAMVYRAEALAKKRAESNFWKARAIGLGAGVNDWENLDGVVKREMVADQRFDPFDFVNDELIEAAEGFQEEQQQQQQQEIVQVGKKAQKGKKRKATEME
nr:uncharacterized protein CTRU02_08819 [Colletotrichum truncatum]KAF6789572.1 hypothetical protein CTRU02_08819 [Colletotrichum truncatum]